MEITGESRRPSHWEPSCDREEGGICNNQHTGFGKCPSSNSNPTALFICRTKSEVYSEQETVAVHFWLNSQIRSFADLRAQFAHTRVGCQVTPYLLWRVPLSLIWPGGLVTTPLERCVDKCTWAEKQAVKAVCPQSKASTGPEVISCYIQAGD